MSYQGKIQGGRRFNDANYPFHSKKPLISVVTVVFNDVQHLKETIGSVLAQNCEAVEYILIDGGSTDGTLEVIKSYQDRIDYWVSEKDQGIYDAMNKGVDLATGSWIIFMNSGDRFYKDDTLLRCSQHMLGTGTKFLFGDMVSDYGSFLKYRKAKPLSKILRGMCFSHQSVFIEAAYHKSNKYDLRYSLAADYDFFLKAYVKGHSFSYLNEAVSLTSVQGVSDRDRFKVISQYRQAVKSHCPSLRNDCFFLYTILDNAVRALAKRILPDTLITAIKRR